MRHLRGKEPGFFVVVDDGAEIVESRRHVAAGFDAAGDQRIVDELRAKMGPNCDVVFRIAEPAAGKKKAPRPGRSRGSKRK